MRNSLRHREYLCVYHKLFNLFGQIPPNRLTKELKQRAKLALEFKGSLFTGHAVKLSIIILLAFTREN